MSNYLLYGIIVILIAAVIILAVLLGTDDNSSKESKNSKALFKECNTNMDCPLGYLCELRDRPSKGICVIPPGGACHSVSGTEGVCYSGHYCDKQDGICLKE
jgi:hypothetical protein